MRADAGGPTRPTATLTEQFKGGLAAPICLTWEWTYACNLSCTHCLSSLRITRLRPSGRGADVWHKLHPTDRQQREIYRWLVDHGDRVLTVWRTSPLFTELRTETSSGACRSCIPAKLCDSSPQAVTS